ncbi:glycosyltransferase family 2 protein [Longispora albida]|uniref:glycosyltransferase family 2 protein n=1 Tax=Longispora albida TaxID=203523 RepID=UPI0003A73845|nr:cellulose synthase catalytic subunit [Longispora albida]
MSASAAPTTVLPAAAQPATPALPSAPTDEELYWYFGPQRRWVLLAVFASYIFTAVTLFLFALRHPALWIFLAVLAVNVAAWLLSLVDGQRQRRITRQAHELLMHSWRPGRYPGVDVYLPTCGEPLDVLANAYRHVARMRWDGPLEVHVLDDAARPEVAELAEAHGFRYHVRPDRPHLKKAGNLNNALTLTGGEYIAIFDADFCPRPDFLAHLAPYLSDPAVGIVQSPQFFDTSREMNWIQRSAGSAQEWFFRWLQPSRDADNAAICCGSNALYRRSAIEEIGGFAKLDHSEDMYTGLELLKRGYRTQYIPVLLAKGISPDTMPAFINQQYRWAMGNLHLVHDRDFHRMRASWRLKASYWSGIAGYSVGAINAFAAPLPPLVMLFGYPGDIRPWHALPILAPLWVWFVLLPAVSKSYWRIEVIRAHLVVSFAGAAAAWHTLRRRSATWVPTGTGSGRSALAVKVSRLAIGWLGLTTLAGWAGFGYAVWHSGLGSHWAVAGYLLLSSYLTLPLIWDLARGLWTTRKKRARKNRQLVAAGA